MKFLNYLLLFLLPAGLLATEQFDANDPAFLTDPGDSAAAAKVQAEDDFPIPGNYPLICRRFATLLCTKHLLLKPLDESISAQAWTNYLMQLDYDRSYFLQKDIEELEPWRLNLSNDLQSGKLDFAIKAFKILRERIENRVAYTDKLIDDGLDFSVDEEYSWNRKEVPWVADENEWNDLWRRKIKNEVLSRIVSRDYAVSNKTDNASALDKTNTVANADASSVTNSVDLSPETVVRKRYEQYKTVIMDSDAEWVLQRFLCSFAMAYDPHTAYMAPAVFDDFNIEMNLSLCGIGATLTAEDGAAKIVEIIPGSPSARDTRDIRLRKGDKIIGVGQGDGPIEDITHKPLNKIVQRIRGKKGTKVVLNVISASDPTGSSTRLVDIIRDEIKLEDQAATGRVIRASSKWSDRSFGYVYLPTFYASNEINPFSPSFRSCTVDICKIISKMNPEISGLVLDLRGNGGGSLREAISLAGSFIRSGPVVQVEELPSRQVLQDRDPSIAFRKPMVVLIDRSSASASEIVAAALQDYGRAVIIGDHMSHGKGSVQNVMALIPSDPSYGSMKITCARFYRINGGSTQLRGVESDIVIPSTLEYLDIGEDKLPNAMPWNKIKETKYKKVYDLNPVIPRLATNSQERLAKNLDFQKHLKLVEHFKNVSERKSVPLEYGRRYALFSEDAKIDKASADSSVDSELDDSEDGKKDKESAKDPEDGIGKDVVLGAAVDVLNDLVDIQGEKAISEPEVSDPVNLLFRVLDKL